MYGIIANSVQEAVNPILQKFEESGQAINKHVKSLSPAFITINDAGKGMFLNSSAKINYANIADECLQIIRENILSKFHLAAFLKDSEFGNKVTLHLNKAIDEEVFTLLNRDEQYIDSVIYSPHIYIERLLFCNFIKYSIIQCLLCDLIDKTPGKITFISAQLIKMNNSISYYPVEDDIEIIQIPRFNKNIFDAQERDEYDVFKRIYYASDQILGREQLTEIGALKSYFLRFTEMIVHGRPEVYLNKNEVVG